jgi:hypothetical protein
MGGIDEQHRATAAPGLVQPGLEFLLEELGLLVGVGLGRDGPYLPPAQPKFFF